MYKKTSDLDLKYIKYTQDSEVFYNGELDEEELLKIITVKGVRIA